LILENTQFGIKIWELVSIMEIVTIAKLTVPTLSISQEKKITKTGTPSTSEINTLFKFII